MKDNNQKNFTAPLEIDSKLYHLAFASSFTKSKAEDGAVCTTGNYVPNCQLLMRWRYSFNGLSHNGRRAKFAKNLPYFPLNKNVSNDTNYSKIHLAGK
jgi:hypothetical protein